MRRKVLTIFPRVVFLFLFTIGFFHPLSIACKIHGTESGYCEIRYLPQTYQSSSVSYKEAQNRASTQWKNKTIGPCEHGQSDFCMPFCGSYIANYYPPCVPLPQSLPRDANFPQGRFTGHTIRAKDRWVEETVASILQDKLSTTHRRGKGFHNPDCRESFTRFFCYLNFPRCDASLQESLPICQTVCENFLRSCGMDSELWRCGEQDYEGYVNEETYFFPGQPFMNNKVYGRMKAAVCTPSIPGSAPWMKMSGRLILSLISFGCVLVLYSL